MLVMALLPMAVLAVLVLILIWVSFQQGFIGTPAATYTIDNYALLVSDPALFQALGNTLQFTLATTFFALAFGLPIAWLTERTTLRGKALVYTLMTLGLLIPSIFVAMGWTFMAHPRIGFLNVWLRGVFGFDQGPINITSPIGMGFIQALSLTSLSFVLTIQVLRAMNPSLEEASQIHGLSFFSTLRRITIPLATPGILAAVIYISTIALSSFDIPAIIGMGNRVYMLSTYLYLKTHPPDSGSPQHGVTAAVGTFMIVLALLLTWWYSQVLKQGHRYQVVTGKGYRPTPIRLGRWSFAAWAFIGGYFAFAKLMPLLMVAYVAFSPYIAPPSPQAFARLTTANFEKISWDLIQRGLTNTVTLVVVVPILVLLFAFCISWLVVRSRSRMRYVLEFGAFLPHVLPEAILAVGALLIALFAVPRFIPLYGSVWLIAIVYIVARLAFATRNLNSSLLQIHRELEEVAFVSGLSALRTAWRVIVPLIRPAVLSVWIWTALLVYREATVAVFLAGQENITLPAVIWSYWFGGAQPQAAAVMFLMTLLFAPLVLAYWWIGRRSQVTVD